MGELLYDQNGMQLVSASWAQTGSNEEMGKSVPGFGHAQLHLIQGVNQYGEKEVGYLIENGTLVIGSANDLDQQGHPNIEVAIWGMKRRAIAGINDTVTATMYIPEIGTVTTELYSYNDDMVPPTEETELSHYYDQEIGEWNIRRSLLTGDENDSDRVQGLIFVKQDDLPKILPSLRFRFGTVQELPESSEEQ